MGKTNVKVISFYDGKREARDVLVGIIIEKIRANMSADVEESKERAYNQTIALYEDRESGLAKVV